MDGLVPIINDLMDIFNGLGFSPINLPMICVRCPSPHMFLSRPPTDPLPSVLRPVSVDVSVLSRTRVHSVRIVGSSSIAPHIPSILPYIEGPAPVDGWRNPSKSHCRS